MRISRFKFCTRWKSLSVGCVVLAVGLIFVGCAGDEVAHGGEAGGDDDKGVAVHFDVSDAQDNMHAAAAKMIQAGAVTRAGFEDMLAGQSLTVGDLVERKIQATATDGTQVCIVETTMPGVDAEMSALQPEAETRAKVVTTQTMGQFSTIGYRGASDADPDKMWFHNAKTKADGTLVDPVKWSWWQPVAKFYGIYPQVDAGNPKLKVSGADHTGTPYIDFEVEQNVEQQQDLMTAYSGVVRYATQGTAPAVPLKFRHALTAVRFKVGSNLSWNKTITKIQILGASSKGRYTLATNAAGTNGSWSDVDAPGNFVLNGINVSTSQAENQIIAGSANDNYTFYMIPQKLDGDELLQVTFSDGSEIHAYLKGEWKAGTTRTYALSEQNSNWGYTFDVESPSEWQYNESMNKEYKITSSRKREDGVLEPVKWKVEKYEESTDGGLTWQPVTEKPSWVTSLTRTNGDGTLDAAGEKGQVAVANGKVDRLQLYNAKLQGVTPKGSSGSPWNLSNEDGSDRVVNTANSYLISAAGHYRIPLVYGNAIRNGQTNEDAYKTHTTHQYTNSLGRKTNLNVFVDHDGREITSPWITETNRRSNVPTAAKLVWCDQAGIVTDIKLSSDKKFVEFQVPQQAIKNGNAVIAVVKNRTVVWSWHLWFANPEELSTILTHNHVGTPYNFSKQVLGVYYRKWNASSYDLPRITKVTVRQEKSRKTGTILIRQDVGGEKEFYSTYYQQGRKDAMPGEDAVKGGSFTKVDGRSSMSIKLGIQHPETFYYTTQLPNDYAAYTNLWSMNYYEPANFSGKVVKTIYDPCPVGFKVPPGDAFTGFAKKATENNPFEDAKIVRDTEWFYGLQFYADDDTAIEFPAMGIRSERHGGFSNMGLLGVYWTASSGQRTPENGIYFKIADQPWGSGRQRIVKPMEGYNRAFGASIRPIVDE